MDIDVYIPKDNPQPLLSVEKTTKSKEKIHNKTMISFS